MSTTSTDRFENLLEAAPDAVMEVDDRGRIVLANASCEQLFGYSRQELIGQSVELLVPVASRGAHEGHRERYSAKPTSRAMGKGMVLNGLRKDGTEVPVQISLSPMTIDGRQHTVAIIRDVTDYRRFEQKLEEARQNAEAASRAKSEFLASMSHELRSPLHTIIGFSELLAEGVDGPLNDKQRRFVHHIQKDSQHLLTLINDILDLSKIEAGRLEFTMEVVDLTSLVQEAVASFRPQADARGLTLSAQCPEQLQAWGDRVRIRQVLDNLLSNAMKFTPAGGSVTVESHALGAQVCLAVTDTGIGISPESLEAIFDVFFQVSATTKGVREGTGLGLAISRKLVEKQGGSIWVESQVGQGSRFQFTLRSAVLDNRPTNRSKPVVLLLEDDLGACELLRSYLEADNYELVCVHAIRDTLVKALEIRPDLIVLDVLLPGASGYDALRSLKRLHETRDIPVLVLSVVADESALKFGATAYLTKPVNKTQFLKTVKRLAPRANPATPGLAPATTGTADSASARAGQPSGIGGSGHLPDY